MMLVLPAELGHAQARACLQMLRLGLGREREARVTVDTGALTHFDSTALAVLLEFRRDCMAAGKQLAVRGMPSRLTELARLYGVDTLLPAA